MPSEDESYRDATKDSLVGHRVRVKATSQTAGRRDLPDGSKKIQIRSQVMNLRDRAFPKKTNSLSSQWCALGLGL